MNLIFPSLSKITAGTILATFVLGMGVPAYANTATEIGGTSTISTSSQNIDAETAALLDEMAADFEKQYESNPEAFNNMLSQLDQSLNAEGTFTRFSPKPGRVTPYASWESYAKCVGDGIASAFAIDVLKQAVNKPVVDALKSRQWKVASSIIHTNLSRILGSKGASFIIKKIANKALPGGLPGQIVWIAGKCGVKEFI